jgi:hypothetical protein
MPAADASACCMRTWGWRAKASAINGGKAPRLGRAWPQAWDTKTAKAIKVKISEDFDFMEFII